MNWGVLMLWVGFFVVAGDLRDAIHTKLFKISRETFNTINYAGMAFFKLLILVFNLVPYLVLQIFL